MAASSPTTPPRVPVSGAAVEVHQGTVLRVTSSSVNGAHREDTAALGEQRPWHLAAPAEPAASPEPELDGADEHTSTKPASEGLDRFQITRDGEGDRTHLAVSRRGDRPRRAATWDTWDPQRQGGWASNVLSDQQEQPSWMPYRDLERFSVPPVEPPRPPWSLSFRRTLVGLLVVVLAAVTAGAAWSVFVNRPHNDPQAAVAEGSSASAPAARSGADVVRRYLNALASGDVTTALTYGPPSTGGTQLLEASKYREQVRGSAPISDVVVADSDPSQTQIPASYNLGGDRIWATFSTVRRSDGTFTMARTTTTLTITSVTTEAGKLPLLVDGIPVEEWNGKVTLQVVPGRYVLTTGLPNLRWTGDQEQVITGLDAKTPDLSVSPAVTDAGRSTFVDAARRALGTCIAATEAAPKGCPFNDAAVNGPSSATPGSASPVQRTLVGDPFANAVVTLHATLPTLATTTVTVTYTVRSTSSGTVTRRSVKVTVSMDLASDQQTSPVWQKP